MTIKVGNAEFTFDGYYNTSQTIHNLADKCYQQGRVDVLNELMDIRIELGLVNDESITKMFGKYEQLKEQKNE